MKRILLTLSAMAFFAFGLPFLGGESSVAAAGSSVSVSLTTSGTSSPNVAPGDIAHVEAAVPVSSTGYAATSVDIQWDPTDATLDPTSISTQSGWNVEYTTDGSSWSSLLPSSTSSIRGVRSGGVLNSNGVTGASQVFGARESATVSVQTDTGSFSGNTGGDGFNAIRVGNYVLDLWHHTYNTGAPGGSHFNLDCHLASTGGSCGSVYQPADAASGDGNTGQWSNLIANGSKVYGMVNMTGAPRTSGLTCTDVSIRPFVSCGYFPLVTFASGFGPWVGNIVRVGTKIYAPYSKEWDSFKTAVACFDLATNAACANSPWDIDSSVSYWPQSVAIGAKIYVGSHFTTENLYCFDTTTNVACTGWTNGKSIPAYFVTPVPMRSSLGADIGVCVFHTSTMVNCWRHDGTVATVPNGLQSALTTFPQASFQANSTAMNVYGHTSTKQLWAIPNSGSGVKGMCYDWLTDAICTNFTNASTLPVVAAPGAVPPYTMTVTDDDKCVYMAADDGTISLFNIETAQSGCAEPGMRTTLNQTSSTTCAGASPSPQWTTLQVIPATGGNVATYVVSIKNSAGVDIANWTNLNPSSSGSIDISTLSYAATGATPRVVVVPTGASNGDLVGATMYYLTSPPALCLNLVVNSVCLAGGGTPPALQVNAASSVSGTAGTGSSAISRNSISSCGVATTTTSTTTSTTTTPPIGSLSSGATIPSSASSSLSSTTTTLATSGTTPLLVSVRSSGGSLPKTGGSLSLAMAGFILLVLGLAVKRPRLTK